ncbi:Inner membrane protein yjgN ORF X [Salmonella enterica subsp. enterica]|nr:Inner membrane protein yjgN ORF X [Salmonella enterica subsp. enterica] [Salmonella enterica subsp. enterica serovar Florida]
MNNVISSKDNHNHTLVFTGKGGKYFVICLVNFLLTCITLGIYAPWAMVKCRRYIYTNMTLNNQPFAYKATGSALFISMLLVFVIYSVGLSFIEHGHPGLGFTLFGLLIAIIPFMAVKGLQYQAMMTSLNGVHFGFQCSMRRAWWYMFALPVLLMVALYIVLYIISLVTIAVGGLVFNIVFLGLLAIIGIGVINGITYSKWMTLFGNGANFGIHRFSIQVNVKTCIRGCVLAMLTLFPFAVVIGYLIAPVFTDMILLSMMGNAQAGGALILQYYGQIMACYFLYFLAIMVVTSYLYAALRNLFLNNLSLANNSIRFHSSVTSHGMLWRLLVVVMISGVTLGLAYPWLKIWLVSWLAQNTQVQGDLDSLELTNDKTAC